MTVNWQDPPRPAFGSNRAIWPDIVAELRKYPGKWALVIESSRTRQTANYLIRRYHVETATRMNDDGTFQVYARWPDLAQDGNDDQPT